jgi:transcription initiation factor TFIIIB Brf1 subunit/transcription initiation factor TFIIB
MNNFHSELIDFIHSSLFLSSQQTVFMPKPYFNFQPEITSRMRTILIDWIIEVHYKYKLNQATLWLTMNIMDRYLEKHVIERGKLQLVGITALFLACKFEEIHSPQVADCVYLTDSAFEKKEILGMEAQIVDSLDYQLSVPTPYHFITRYLLRMKAIDRIRLIAFFVSERSLQEVEVLTFSPRVYAAGCVYLAYYVANYELIKANRVVKLWPPALEEESGGLKESELMECARALLKNAREPPQASTRRKLDAVKKKYSTPQCQFIGEMEFPPILIEK